MSPQRTILLAAANPLAVALVLAYGYDAVYGTCSPLGALRAGPRR
jgi:hypothetical protein